MSARYYANRVKFFPLSLDDLEKLSQTESGIVLRKNCSFNLRLNYSALPVNSNNFKRVITEELNKRVLKYNSDLNDMIIKYTNVRIKTPIEATRSRKLNVLCIANIYVFKPQCEDVLSATVNKISKNHVGCLMYNTFNVSIIKPPEVPYNQWPGRHVEVDDTITFKVVKVDVSEVIPYVIGEFPPDIESSFVKETDEKDSVISTDHTDHTSLVTSDERYSDLEDVLETIDEPKSRKRKLSDKFQKERVKFKKRKID